MSIFRMMSAAVVATILGASAAFSAPRADVSGAVCQTTREFVPVAPRPGEILCLDYDTPIKGVIVTVKRAKTGEVVVKTRTRADGSYRVTLPPGKYRISAENALYSLTITVKKKRIRHLDFIQRMSW